MKRLPLCYKNYLTQLPATAVRVLRGVPAGVVDLASNDSLGLSRHPEVIRRAGMWLAEYGAGGRASRLVAGEHAGFAALEAKLARQKRTEAALVLGSGFVANATLIPALLDRRVLGADAMVFADRLNHSSLWQGLAAAGAVTRPGPSARSGIKDTGIRDASTRDVRHRGPTVRRFRHNDLDHLESLLAATADHDAPRFIITESLFSMDGDGPDLGRLVRLGKQYGAFLYLDEAHCTGMCGPDGMGRSTEVPGQVDLVMGTFSKGLGSYGAYIACSAVLREYLVNRCQGLIYSTALPPAALGAVDAALDLVPGMGDVRARIHSLAQQLRQGLQDRGFLSVAGTSHIVPVILGDAGATLDAAAFLLRHGFYCPAIRPPTVPEGGCRLRISLHPGVDAGVIERLLVTLTAWREGA